MEQIDKFAYIREGRRYEDNMGLTTEGLPIMWMDSLDLPVEESKGQLVRDSPLRIIIDFQHDSQGRAVLSNVHTSMKRFLIANNGDVLLKTAHPLEMDANRRDKLDFVALFWEQAKRFIANGRVRKFLGFNYLPLFGQLGEFLVYTPEQELEAPSKDYETHNADGTPIITETDATT